MPSSSCADIALEDRIRKITNALSLNNLNKAKSEINNAYTQIEIFNRMRYLTAAYKVRVDDLLSEYNKKKNSEGD